MSEDILEGLLYLKNIVGEKHHLDVHSFNFEIYEDEDVIEDILCKIKKVLKIKEVILKAYYRDN